MMAVTMAVAIGDGDLEHAYVLIRGLVMDQKSFQSWLYYCMKIEIKGYKPKHLINRKNWY